jgi:phosphatidylglycerophosphate synthase
MGSDLYTFYQYRAAGQDFFASATLAILGVSMLMQLVLVIAQDHRSVPAMLKGMFLALSFLKPALDARRVVEGAVQEAHQLFSPFIEQVVSKGMEVAFESAPAAFVQMWALVLTLSAANQQSPPNPMQILSILISALTAAFVVASTFCEPHLRGSPCRN